MNSSQCQMQISFASKSRIIFEEIYLMDMIGLVGSLGGSLGLFVSFSFFDAILHCLENLQKKFLK